MMPLLATANDYTPFIDSAHAVAPWLSDVWYLLAIPLILVIAVVYKTMRHEAKPPTNGRSLPVAIVFWAGKVIMGLVIAGVLISSLYWISTR
ncbi:MAG: hypothetical protein WCJ97_03310 [Phycisphaerae bacterium]